ncbi:hypothetical protein KKG83_06100 [Candidatus Micrarchaeota archaeon]|nr:hypothetical protein [Candidatus Micrarchaeota archaeon]MBU2477015.1 hypothetical protein [Candidatus Micrarchaeota archaeon]
MAGKKTSSFVEAKLRLLFEALISANQQESRKITAQTVKEIKSMYSNCASLGCEEEQFALYLKKILERQFFSFERAKGLRKETAGKAVNRIAVVIMETQVPLFYLYAFSSKRIADYVRHMAHPLSREVDALFFLTHEQADKKRRQRKKEARITPVSFLRQTRKKPKTPQKKP